MILVGMLTVVFLVGCSNNDINQNIRQAVTDNQNAQNKAEWDLSAAHPDELFKSWRLRTQDMKDEELKSFKKELCTSLEGLEGKELSLFESNLKDSLNSFLVEVCKESLLTRIDDFYKNSDGPVRRSVWFRDHIQTRDVSKGYVAVTGDVSAKQIVLTFDDGPSGVYTPRILKALKDVNAKALFFALGKNANNNANLLRQIVAEGHGVGSHSWAHACLGDSRSCENMRGAPFSLKDSVSDIVSGHTAIFSILGQVEPFFRFPYGEGAPALRQYLAQNGVADFSWNIDSEDWRAVTPAELVHKTLEQIERQKKGIVLFHDIQRRTAEALPAFLEQVYLKGYEIVLLQAQDPRAKYNPRIVERPKP